ncbi:MAG: hypothetical protein K1X56_07550 [Flavobacteriales bacterium]|nr:hypothetical protein [Flavobacteriales bacterium]
MKKYFILFIILGIGLSSCEKQAWLQYKFSGVFNIKKITKSYYTNGQLTSSREINDMCIIRFYDNATDYNNVYVELDSADTDLPMFLNMNSIENGLFWKLDETDEKRFLFMTSDPYEDYVLVYSVVKQKHNSFQLAAVRVDSNGQMIYDEQIEFERIKP